MINSGGSNSAASPNIVVVGSGIDLLQSALAAARLLSFARPSITVIELDGSQQSPEVMASFSDMAHFHSLLGIDEGAFIRGARAGLSFGTELRLDSDSAGFVFSDGPYGFIIEGLSFHDLFDKASSVRPSVRYDEYCLSALLAKANRVAPRSSKAKSVYSTVRYGYLFKRKHYQAYLKALLESHGVSFLRTASLTVERLKANDAVCSEQINSHNIARVVTDAGKSVVADLFIDCSLSRELVSDSPAAHELSLIDGSVLPPHRVGVMNGLSGDHGKRASVRLAVSPSGFDRDLAHLSVETIESLQFQWSRDALVEGRGDYEVSSELMRPWSGNCVAVGLASAHLPSLIPGAYNLLQNQLLLLFDVWTGGALFDSARDVYNNFSVQASRHSIDIANFLLHKHPNSLGLVELTPVNLDRLRLFECSGCVRPTDGGVIGDDHWIALMIALGCKPRGESLKKRSVESGVAIEQLDRLRALLVNACDAAEPYEKWLSVNLKC